MFLAVQIALFIAIRFQIADTVGASYPQTSKVSKVQRGHTCFLDGFNSTGGTFVLRDGQHRATGGIERPFGGDGNVLQALSSRLMSPLTIAYKID